MKNNHSYYFHKLLTECIKTPGQDNKPTLMVSATIGVLHEYAEDYAGDLFQGEPIEIIENPKKFNDDVEYILECMEYCNKENWKQAIQDRLKNIIGKAERRGAAIEKCRLK